jgi:hypothetical protein
VQAPGIPPLTRSGAPAAGAGRTAEKAGAGALERPFRAVLRQQIGKRGDREIPDGREAQALEQAGPSPAAELFARESLPREPILIEHRPAARPAAPAPAVARLFVGQGTSANEARLELRGGVLGGAAIHLVSEAGGVQVRVGAPSEPARLALGRLLDHVGLRLRSRGIVMRAGRDLAGETKHGGRGGARRGT